MILTLLTVASSSASEQKPYQQVALKVRTIYLDPWFGGEEKGPLIAPKQYAKDITLKIAKELKPSLETEGFIVHLSRDKDHFVSLDDRGIGAKMKSADIHVGIRMSQAKKECIKVNIVKPQQKKRELKSNDINKQLANILDDLMEDAAREESRVLGGILKKEFKNSKLITCAELVYEDDWLLRYVEMPAVTIDIGVSTGSSKKASVIERSGRDNVVRCITTAVKAYTELRAPKVQ